MEWIPFWLQDMRLAMDLLEDKELALYVRCCFEYVVDGTLPADGDLPKSVRACFNQTKQHIDNAIKKYEDRCETNRNNINRRWNKTKADDGSPPADGNPYDRIPSNTTVYGDEVSYTEREVERDGDIERERDGDVDGDAESAASSIPAPAPSFPDSKELAKKYLNDSGIAKVEALEDDIKQYGLEAVRSALKTAAEHDSRGGVTLAYYRKILQNQMSEVQAHAPKSAESSTRSEKPAPPSPPAVQSKQDEVLEAPRTIAEEIENGIEEGFMQSVYFSKYPPITEQYCDYISPEALRKYWQRGLIYAAPGIRECREPYTREVNYRSVDNFLYWSSLAARTAWINSIQSSSDIYKLANCPDKKLQKLIDSNDKGWKFDFDYFIKCAVSEEEHKEKPYLLTRDQCIAIAEEYKRTGQLPRTYRTAQYAYENWDEDEDEIIDDLEYNPEHLQRLYNKIHQDPMKPEGWDEAEWH